MITPIPRRTFALALALVAACGLGCGEPIEEKIALRPGLSLTRTMAEGRPHAFRFRMEADQWLELSIEQHGVDVEVFLFAPTGESIFEIDSPTGARGAEAVQIASSEAGSYRLVIEPLDDAEGAFTLDIQSLRSASGRDRAQAGAVAGVAKGDRRRLGGDFPAAAEAYRQAVPWLEASGDESELARVRWRLGQVLAELGELQKAETALGLAAADFRTLGDPLGEARALNDLGTTHRDLGALERAWQAHQRSRSLYQQLEIETGEATALNDLGLVAEARGDLRTAAVLYTEALTIWRRSDRPIAEAATLQNLGSLYGLIGREEEALEFLEEALRVVSATGNTRRRISALIAVGWGEYLAAHPEQALVYYREAIALAREISDSPREGAALDRQGTALRALGLLEEAKASYDQALRISQVSGGRLSGSHTLANLGWLALESGDLSAAVQTLEQAKASLAELGDPNAEIYVLVGLARAERRRGESGRARAYLEQAVELVESLRTQVAGGLSRSHFLAARYDVFEELATLWMDFDRREPGRGHYLRALEVAERGRARSLLESLPFSEVAQEDTSRRTESRRRALDEIRALEGRRLALLNESPGDPLIEDLERRLRLRWLEVERLETLPEWSAGEAETPLSAGEIQSLADEETLLILYLLAEPESFAWTIDPRGIEVHRLPGREQMERRSRQAAALLRQKDLDPLAAQESEVLADLSRIVLAPLEPRLRGWKRLAILPDGALHLVPFGALPMVDSEGEPGAEPLLVHHELTTLASVTVLARQRRSLAGRKLAPGAVAVVADPVFSARDRRLAANSSMEPAPLPVDLRRTLDELDLGSLERLPETASEAAAILALAGLAQSLDARDFEANRQLVESGALSEYRIVHFATHGLLHPVHPGLSGLVLSLFDPSGQPADGFLRSHEIATLDLPAELVVLSACQTGLGREVRGEGLVGLPQAFFRAGARRVIVSSWNVDDGATSELMAYFYRHLLSDGLPPAAALRRAQLTLREEPGRQSPYYWAAFSLHGDWQ